MSEIKTWDVAAGGNDSPSPNGFPEHMDRTGVNNSDREVMASVRRWYNDPTWVDTFYDYTVTKDSAQVVRIAGIDATGMLVDDRRIYLSGGTADVGGFVDSTSYAASDTLVTVTLDGGVTVPVGTDTIEMHAVAAGRAALRNVLDSGGAVVQADVVSVGGLVDAAASELGTAALLDTGTNPGELPTNADLGTAAAEDQGTGAAELPNTAEVEALIAAAGKYSDVVPITTETYEDGTSVTWSPLDWTGVEIVGADGTKTYRITVLAFIENGDEVSWTAIACGAAGDFNDPRLCFHPDVGTNGVFSWNNGGTNEFAVYLAAIVKPAAADRFVTFVIDNVAIDTSDRKIKTLGAAGVPQRSLLTIEEV